MKLLAPTTLALAFLGLGALAPALAAPVALSKPNLSTHIRQIAPLADGNLCIVGQTMDPDGDLQSRGMVVLYSVAQGKVLWQQTVDAPDDNAASRFVACRSDGKALYVAANVDTHSESSLNQGLAYLYRFDFNGKVLGVKELVTGTRNAFIYDIAADASGVTAAGIARDVKAGRQTNAIFLAKLDPALKEAQVSKIEKGAYANGSAARLAGGALYVAGNFAPAAAAVDARPDDYAASKIVAGKYQFSVRPQKARTEEIATTISATLEIVSLGVAGKTTTLTVVGPDGKLKDSKQLASTYCQTGNIATDANTVYAVRTPCGRSQDPARLVAIARTGGGETVVNGIVGEPVHVLAIDGKLIVIARKGNGSLSLQTIARGR